MNTYFSVTSLVDFWEQGPIFATKMSSRFLFIWLSLDFKWIIKKGIILTFKVNFQCQKNIWIFISFKNIHLREQFFVTSIFWWILFFETLCFLKLFPISDFECQWKSNQKNFFQKLIFEANSTSSWPLSSKNLTNVFLWF